MEVKIIATGGHCNRLRAIATGVAVAKKDHCPSVIYWNNSLGLKADYCELFNPIPQDDVKLVENIQWLYNIYGNKDYLVRWALLKTMFEQTVFNFSIYRDGEIYSKLKMSYSRSLLLISCYPMCTKYTIQGMFVPQDDIQRRIDEVKESLKSKYPNRIITLMDDTDRNSLEGMKFAMVDLFCLSKTRKIIGNVASSYSQIAAEIGGIEIEYAK
ncbi:hypothetical protein I6E75_03920 [Prevotella copri]|uniref:hypothetical protein n=1 Tax=Segatella copri TaxID=165179 RepID=UPI001F47E171|nr:hypothetical protein [Segatella copri]MCF2609404.1 hypothetical protein [Segatella copri]